MKTQTWMMGIAACLAAEQVHARFLSVDPVPTDPNNGQNFNRYAYANNNPYKNIDPDGRDCRSAEGRTTCDIQVIGSHIPKTISFPTPDGVSGTQKSSSAAEHSYDYMTPHLKSDKSVQQSIVNNPTPGNDEPATPAGTPNNATPAGGRGVLAQAGRLFGNDPSSPVMSYSGSDQNGNTWVVNVTQPGHGLHFGYVLRGSVDGTAMSIGEGWAIPQAIPGLSGYINDVWIDQNMKNINDAQ